jgi:RNA polymerase sigma-70 factor, ECF subfamily
VTDESILVELMIAYQSGDLSAFEQLYASLADEVRRYIHRVVADRHTADDLVQDTFLELHRSRETYTPPLPVRPWVYGIARHVCARSRRAAHSTPSIQAVDFETDLLAAPGSETSLTDTLDTQGAIEMLPQSVREPWLLHHVFGFSFESIAIRLRITPMAAKLRSSRATKALRVALKAERRRQR